MILSWPSALLLVLLVLLLWPCCNNTYHCPVPVCPQHPPCLSHWVVSSSSTFAQPHLVEGSLNLGSKSTMTGDLEYSWLRDSRPLFTLGLQALLFRDCGLLLCHLPLPDIPKLSVMSSCLASPLLLPAAVSSPWVRWARTSTRTMDCNPRRPRFITGVPAASTLSPAHLTSKRYKV